MRGRVCPQLFNDRNSRHIGQHKIKQNQIRLDLERHAQAAFAIIGKHRLIERFPERHLEDDAICCNAINNQNIANHALCCPSAQP